MSVCFLTNWLLTNLPRLHAPLHTYLIHQLTTGHAQLVSGNPTIHLPGGGGVTTESSSQPEIALQQLLDATKDEVDHGDDANKNNKMAPILVWLLRCSLPPKFLAIFAKNATPQAPPPSPHSPYAMTSAQLLLQLIHTNIRKERPCWDLLYNSDLDGLSINRFQFHVFNYRGPTCAVIRAENGYSFAICVDTEWKESCHFWGGEDALLVQLQPEFRIVESKTNTFCTWCGYFVTFDL